VGRPKGKRPLGRSKCTWKSINMDLQEVSLVYDMAFFGLRIGTRDELL
jgi:hypothetical protein